VVTRWKASGTHQGEFFGVAPTGKRIEMTGMQIDRFDEESGKMVEEWPEYDLLRGDAPDGCPSRVIEIPPL
jgi:predicted ester cyclase